MSIWDKRSSSAKPCLAMDAPFQWTCFQELQVFFGKKESVRLKGVCVRVCVCRQLGQSDEIWVKLQAVRDKVTLYGKQLEEEEQAMEDVS